MENITDLKIDSREAGSVSSTADITYSKDDRPKRKVQFQYVASTIFTTYRRKSRVFELDADDGWFKRFSIGLPYSIISLVAGWWGFPFGLLYTPLVIIKNTFGGRDVTFEEVKEGVKVEKFINNKLQDTPE